ncbi:MAG: hypothetical protein WCN88_04650 [Candidatus Falkowbacteria bacterium]
MHHLLRIFDNNTFAGLITVFAAALVGKFIYREQKDIDRRYNAEDKITEALFLLEEHCRAVNQCIDRLACTYIRIVKNNDEEALKKFPKESLPLETNRLGKVLMYKLPEDISKIETMMSLYFPGDNEFEGIYQEIFEEFNKWHNFVQSYITGKTDKTFDLNKRVVEVPELSLEKLKNKIILLINLFPKKT